MRLHSGERPYKCDICDKRFARGGQVQHVHFIRGAITDSSLRFSLQLTQHLATHNILKKHQCAKCPASFACSMSYKLHLKRHSNERDLTCHLCGKSFIRPDALKKHLTGFHENLKAFYCHICSRTFKGHLPQHIRTHEKTKLFNCTICDSFFSQKSQLIVHQRIHSGERPYRCQVSVLLHTTESSCLIISRSSKLCRCAGMLSPIRAYWNCIYGSTPAKNHFSVKCAKMFIRHSPNCRIWRRTCVPFTAWTRRTIANTVRYFWKPNMSCKSTKSPAQKRRDKVWRSNRMCASIQTIS